MCATPGGIHRVQDACEKFGGPPAIGIEIVASQAISWLQGCCPAWGLMPYGKQRHSGGMQALAIQPCQIMVGLLNLLSQHARCVLLQQKPLQS